MNTPNLHKKKIVYAFIDSQNLNLGIKSRGWDLDFKRFRVYLRDKYTVKKAFLFIGYINKYKKLYTELESFGYILVFKNITLKKNRIPKGNVDSEIVLFASAIEYRNYDSAILISGDGDFHCLITFLISNKKFSRLLIPNRKGMSKLLWDFSEYTDYLENLDSKLGK